MYYRISNKQDARKNFGSVLLPPLAVCKEKRIVGSACLALIGYSNFVYSVSERLKVLIIGFERSKKYATSNQTLDASKKIDADEVKNLRLIQEYYERRIALAKEKAAKDIRMPKSMVEHRYA